MPTRQLILVAEFDDDSEDAVVMIENALDDYPGVTTRYIEWKDLSS